MTLVPFYLNEDAYRVLQMLEYSGLIKNRSQWLSELLYDYAMTRGVSQAFDQRIEEVRERLATLEALRSETVKVEIDRELAWSKLVGQHIKRGISNRSHNLEWLRGHKKELKFARPGISIEDALDEIEKEAKYGEQ